MTPLQQKQILHRLAALEDKVAALTKPKPKKKKKEIKDETL